MNLFDVRVHVFNKVHALTMMLGIEASSTHYTGDTGTQYGYMRDRGKSFAQVPLTITAYGSTMENSILKDAPLPTIIDRKTNSMGTYFTLNYAYDNRYVANLSVRFDASNRFGRSTNENFNPACDIYGYFYAALFMRSIFKQPTTLPIRYPLAKQK